MQLQAGVDMVARFDAARGKASRREPTWRARRDPLHKQPAPTPASRRAAAVNRVWGGSLAAVWTDILNNQGRHLFVPGFVCFVMFR